MTTNGSHTLSEQADHLKSEFEQTLASVKDSPSPDAVEQLRLEFLGRKGKISALMEGLRNCTKEERPLAGKAINVLKQSVESTIDSLKESASQWSIKQKLGAQALDVSLPVGSQATQGSLHPVTLMRQVLQKEFRRLGFTIYDGPEIDLQFYNFNGLNIPDHHPARDMQDTFYVEGNEELVLRTHTSNIQIHAMLNEKPPLRIVALGRVFRCDSDPTHTPMFHQIEGFVVDKDITFAHLKGVMDSFLKAVFGSDLKTRFRPSYFPFVEPGAEMDLQCTICRGKGCRVCKQTGWLELGGCGMIHPNVFENVEYDSEAYTGFAFGFGIDRMAMLKYGLTDLRQLFEGHSEFLGQFPVHT
jgi:phenylalanyl-tRNA synthetase alpha chain